MSRDEMLNISDMDKLDETYSFRLPEITKRQLDRLPVALKKKLNLRLLYVAAEILHESKFDPRLYLSTKD